MGAEKLHKYISELKEQLELQTLLADSSSEAIGVFDEKVRCVAVNREVLEVLGYTHDEVIGMGGLDLVAEEYRELVRENISSRYEQPYFVMGRRKDGSTFPAEIRGRTVQLRDKTYRISAIRDISYLKATEMELRETLHELKIIFESSKAGMMFLKGGRILKRANQALADILGYESPADMVGLGMIDLHLTEEKFHEFGKLYYYTLVNKAQVNIEYQLKRKDGKFVWCSLSGQAVDVNVPADLNRGVLWVVNDISQRKAEEKRLLLLATTDSLTGAYNRREFFRQVELFMQGDKRNPAGPSMLMVDLDNFKKINDAHGHEAGDAVLRHFADICRSVIRDDDVFARMGGEEFAVFLPGTDLAGGIAVGERLCRKFAASEISIQSGIIKCTASIGVASMNSRRLDTNRLLRMADMALYDAKESGRNLVCFYD
ncbi:diguanylate cyclase [Desulfovibrio sp. JC022]|uniref:sensor domain-containing diguanylate cyclase n=1 Tax=Desulfovibrio sp. JC022 TaxID=2593642 RepID=UPI0013D8929A|nr:diguanylate cyclase [Desulfovibrio sp. JC022]NDV21260.1 diguanylate cyclase [Desulfovibrio sp. JC022]